MKTSISPSPKNSLTRGKTKPTVLVYRHVPHEGLGTLAGALRRAGIAVRIVDTPRTTRWRDPLRFAGLIVMGGPMGVYQKNRFPFLKKELAGLRRAIRGGKPVLGVCLGAQLIAHALGARVYPNRRKEIGWFPLRATPAGRRDPLFRTTSASSTVFQWHGDTFDLPRGARLLATAPRCRHQAFVHGSRVYGLQYHWEVDAALVTDWLGQPGADAELAGLTPRERRDIGKRLVARGRRLAREAAPFFDGFARLCKVPVSSRTKKG